MPGARRARLVVPGTVQSPDVQQLRWASIGHILHSQLRELCTKGVVEGVHGPETGTVPDRLPPVSFLPVNSIHTGTCLGSRMDAKAFSPEVRELLKPCYTEDEITLLEEELATPPSALHVRVNLQRCSRDELLALLLAHERLHGYAITCHPRLSDVVAIQRRASAPELAPYVLPNALGVTSPQRFIERKRRGLPPHEVFVDRICGEAILKGADIFVKGIRAASMGLAAGDIVSVYVDVTGRLTRGQSCEALGTARFVGVGECLMDRSSLFKLASGLGVRMRHVLGGDLPALRDVSCLEGFCYVQVRVPLRTSDDL